jgi:hypothetical protein
VTEAIDFSMIVLESALSFRITPPISTHASVIAAGHGRDTGSEHYASNAKISRAT